MYLSASSESSCSAYVRSALIASRIPRMCVVMRSPVVGVHDEPWESSEDRGERGRERASDSNLLLNELVSINGFSWRHGSVLQRFEVPAWVTNLGIGELILWGTSPFFPLVPRRGDGFWS